MRFSLPLPVSEANEYLYLISKETYAYGWAKGECPQRCANYQELYQACRRIGFNRIRRHQGHLRCVGRGKCPAFFTGKRDRLGNCRIFHASQGHPYPLATGILKGEGRWKDPRNPAVDRPIVAVRHGFDAPRRTEHTDRL